MDDCRNNENWLLYHSMNTCFIGMAIAVKRGYAGNEIEEFGLGCMLHDLGKAGFSRTMVNGEGLNEEERMSLCKHPEMMFRVLQRRQYNIPTTYAVWQHHEHADGTGYPHGLQDKSITPWGGEGEKGVWLYTMHGSKGLEFDTVFLPELTDNVIPGSLTLGRAGVEEERRLLYVAMTRARHRLVMSYTEDEARGLRPSFFLEKLKGGKTAR